MGGIGHECVQEWAGVLSEWPGVWDLKTDGTGLVKSVCTSGWDSSGVPATMGRIGQDCPWRVQDWARVSVRMGRSPSRVDRSEI